MQNQLMQVKTQVAIAIADQHVLERKQRRTRKRSRNGSARLSWQSTRSKTIWRAPRSSAR
jgi:phage shock protein A